MSAVICPTVTSTNLTEYYEQLRRVQRFASRIHLDFMDGHFAPAVSPSLKDISWSRGPVVDLHVMYQDPLRFIEPIIALSPHLVIVHAEAENIADIFKELDGLGIKRGIALLPETPPTVLDQYANYLDHVLIFSGNLGHFGGQVDLTLLHKVTAIKKLKASIEIGWDGGINDKNIADLVAGGIEVLNVGGYIQKADNPEDAYATLETAIGG